MLYPVTCLNLRSLDIGWAGCGGGFSRGAASVAGYRRSGGTASCPNGFLHCVFCILTRGNALTPDIQGGSRMRETRPCGFVRGVPGDWHPYRASQTFWYELSLPVI